MENSSLTISFKIKGLIDQEHIVKFFEQMAAIAKEDREINLVLEIYRIESIQSVNRYFSDLRTKQKALKHLRKFALIADADWTEELGDFMDHCSSDIAVKVFDYNEREEANTWVQALTRMEDHNLKEKVKQGYAHLLHM